MRIGRCRNVSVFRSARHVSRGDGRREAGLQLLPDVDRHSTAAVLYILYDVGRTDSDFRESQGMLPGLLLHLLEALLHKVHR